MARTSKSLIGDERRSVSLKDDSGGLSGILRKARLTHRLTQRELASRLGLRQRQISDLERATTDPRLSTIQNVARALDMEVMLIPRHLIAAVEGLQRTGTGSKPLYALDDDVSSTDEDDTRTELGGDNQPQRRREP